MTWSKEPPREPGFWWVRRKGCHPGVVSLITYGMISNTDYRTSLVVWDGRFPEPLPGDAEWAGPIPEPEEAS